MRFHKFKHDLLQTEVKIRNITNSNNSMNKIIVQLIIQNHAENSSR